MILAPTLSLSAGSGAAIARPTFSRDFAGEKTLNNGTGPAITFTRASNATFFDANGTLQTAANDTPRFDHDPATGASRGLLIEEARTNSIRNSQAGGAAAGVLFSGSGVVPTNWGISNKSTDGVTTEITSVGTESGIAYFDLKISGTPTATSAVYIAPEPRSQVVASSGQTWTSSVYLKIVAGALTNLTRWHIIEEGDSSGNYLIGGQVTLTPTSSSLNTQRYSFTRTLTNASAARVRGLISIEYTNGQQIGGSVNGLTLRIAAPQLEQGAFATSYIPTTTAAATRAADSAVVTPISSFYNQAEGTLFAHFNASGSLNLQTVLSAVAVGDVSNDSVFIFQEGGGVNGWVTGRLTGASGFTTRSRAALAYATGAGASMAVDGSLFTNGALAQSAQLDKLGIGLLATGSGNRVYNGHIRKIAYYPRRLSNTLLQQLTT